MDGLSIRFLQAVSQWGIAITAIAGVVSVAAALFAALASAKESDLVREDANTRILEAKANSEAAQIEAEKAKADAAIANAEAAKASAEAAKANKRAAELANDAAQARLAQERLKQQLAWRVLTPQQYTNLVAALKGHGLHVEFLYLSTDPESATYAESIEKALREAGVTIEAAAVMDTMPHFGVVISSVSVRNSNGALAKSLNTLLVAFDRAGIPVLRGRDSEKLTIFVGSKPPPR